MGRSFVYNILSIFLVSASLALAEQPQPSQAQHKAAEKEAEPQAEAQPVGKYRQSIVIEEPLGLAWQPQLVFASVKLKDNCRPETLQLQDASGNIIPHQVVESLRNGKYLRSCRLAFITGLQPYEMKIFSLRYDDRYEPPEHKKRQPEKKNSLITPDTVLRSIMTSGTTSIRYLSGSAEPDDPLPALNAPAPVEAVKGVDGVWRGWGQILSPYQVKYWEAEKLADGPVFARARVRYQFTGGHFYELTFTAVRDLNCITVSEKFDMGDKSCFILRAPNRECDLVNLPDIPEKMALIISRLAPHHQQGATIAGLPVRRFETVAPANARDLFAIFSVEPGQWKNPVGSAINLTKLYSGLCFHFPLETGTRKWAIQTSAIDAGTTEHIQAVIRQSDLPLHTILDMNLTGTTDELVLLKNPKPAPEEAMRAAALLALAIRPLEERNFSEVSIRNADLDQVIQAAEIYRKLDAAGLASGTLAKRVRARLVFFGRLLYNPSFYAWNILLQPDQPAGANYDPATIDWLYNVRRIRALAHIALAVPGWNESDTWLWHVEDQYALTLEFLFTPYGMWRGGEQQHPHAVHLLESLAQTLKAENRRDFTDDEAYRIMQKYQPFEKQ